MHPAAGHETGHIGKRADRALRRKPFRIGGVRALASSTGWTKDTTGLMVVADERLRAYQSLTANSPTMVALPAGRSAATWLPSGACRTACAAPSTRRSTATPRPREDGGPRKRPRGYYPLGNPGGLSGARPQTGRHASSPANSETGRTYLEIR